MSKTHTGDITNAAKKVSRWLIDKAKGAGHPTTETELKARVKATCNKFVAEDRLAIARASVIFFMRDDPEGYRKFAYSEIDWSAWEREKGLS